MHHWFITGVSSGFGLAIAKAALERGDVVAGTVRTEASLAAFESLQPGRAIGLLMDAMDHETVKRAVAQAQERNGGIDILVANAGRGLVGAIEETSHKELHDLFAVNVFGAIAVMQAVLPGMRQRRHGHIINITSVSGLSSWAGTGIYGATKHAMQCIGQTLADEVAELGIKVTNVVPGGFRTDFSGSSLASVACKLQDYDGTARDASRILADHHGSEPGDPARAAAAILTIAGTGNPPLNLLLGRDAAGYAAASMGRLQADIDQWRDLTMSTDFQA